ncbi:MAG: hypothetical protein CMJ83_20935 [Planctomycetes bacterium]|nr:hypothetical protein [Planctomycetota bacterium]
MISGARGVINRSREVRIVGNRWWGKRMRTDSGRIAVAVGFVVLLGSGCSSGPESEAPGSSLVTEIPLRADAHEILVPGEESYYGISWAGLLPVGRIVYRYDEVETKEGRFLVYEGITEPLLSVEAFLKSAGTIRTLADPKTFLPVTSFWVTANKSPHKRTTVFDQEKGIALAGKWADGLLQYREVKGIRMMDPLGIIFYGRLVKLPDDGSEIRVMMIEGSHQHLMTVRHAGEEALMFHGQRVQCTKVSLRTDRLDDNGELIVEKPWNDLVAWVAETPNRPILRISGNVRFGSMVLKLAKRTVPEVDTDSE